MPARHQHSQLRPLASSSVTKLSIRLLCPHLVRINPMLVCQMAPIHGESPILQPLMPATRPYSQPPLPHPIMAEPDLESEITEVERGIKTRRPHSLMEHNPVGANSNFQLPAPPQKPPSTHPSTFHYHPPHH